MQAPKLKLWFASKYSQNAHGDVVNLTDAEGNVTKTYTYDAFGVEVNPDSGDINVFRFCGEYFDTETGTIYLRARYYTTVSEICANTGFDAYDDNNYWSCMEYLDNRDYSNDYYEWCAVILYSCNNGARRKYT